MINQDLLNRMTAAEDTARAIRNTLERAGVSAERCDLGGHVVRLAGAVTQLAQAVREALQ